MTDRVLIPIDGELVHKLKMLVAPGDDSALEAIVDRALAGDPAKWRRPPEIVHHNHPTREILPQGKCPACDLYWRVHPIASETVGCPCCPDGKGGFACRRVFTWRGLERCGCPKGPRPGAGRPGIVQADLDRE